jgi:hypothetical protein
MYHCHLDYRTKCVLIINAIPLFESFCNQLSLVSINGSIWLFLDLVDPLAVNYILCTMRWDEMPSLVLLKS